VGQQPGEQCHYLGGRRFAQPGTQCHGREILDGEDDLDFTLPGLLPIEWQRYYSSRDERRDGLFGSGWSVIYEVFLEIGGLAEGGER